MKQAPTLDFVQEAQWIRDQNVCYGIIKLLGETIQDIDIAE